MCETIYVEGKSLKTLDLLAESIKQLIAKRHHINQDKDIEDLLQIWNMVDVKNALESTTKTTSLLLGSIVAISLIVGGIGIMNIMLVSVTERTREIGLRKALGAHNKDIMVQFLIEALLMTVLGEVFGIILGSGVLFLITVFAGWEVRISALSILLATAFSIVVGLILVFGSRNKHRVSILFKPCVMNDWLKRNPNRNMLRFLYCIILDFLL